MKKPPTDLQILTAIYDRHYDKYAFFSKEVPNRATKIYVPIEINQIAADLRIDADIIFGRLYYDLNKRFGYRQVDDSKVEFFALKIGEDVHCINFPYLASVLASLHDAHKQFWIATTVALVSLAVSMVSLFISVFV